MNFDFTMADVFSDRPFGGNQLAVFPRAEGLAGVTMQQLAREFNFAETTFVLPPDDPAHTCRVRIFTPRAEVPFAGHPTVGTAAVLASLGEKHPAPGRFVFEEGIGPVTVTADGPKMRLHIQSPQLETPAETPSIAEVARALSLSEADVVDSWYAGVGLRFCFVHLVSPEVVDKAVLDKAAWASGVADRWSPHLYLFAGDCRDGARLHGRFFAPAFGIDEDPATGSASGTLAASIAQRSPLPDYTCSIRIDQGVSMGRPSLIEATARKEQGQIAELSVGGCAVIVATGAMHIAVP